MDSSGNILKDKFKDYVESNYEESWLDTDKIVSTCLAEIQTAVDKSDKKECNPSGLTGAYCLFREVQMKCPDDEIVDKKSCAKFRDRVKKFGDPGSVGVLRDDIPVDHGFDD